MTELFSKVEHSFEFPPKSNHHNCIIKASEFLNHISIPNIQREVNNKWVDELEKDIFNGYKDHECFHFGRFEVGIVGETSYLLDGQHRFLVLQKLPPEHSNILIELKVRILDSEEELNNWFMKINKIRKSKICKSVQTKLLINSIRKHLSMKYSKYISYSKNPHKPNINLDKLEERMIKNNIVEKLDNFSIEEIIEKIEDLNRFYRYSLRSTWKSWNVESPDLMIDSCNRKSPLNPLFLGMYKNCEWIDRLVYILERKITFGEVNHIPESIRVSIPKKLRREVWNKRNNKLSGKCFCCDDKLDYDNFESGHIVSIFFGGKTSLENLEPICRTCNNDMRTKNLISFKEKYYKKNK
jgi:hypothetical protein